MKLENPQNIPKTPQTWNYGNKATTIISHKDVSTKYLTNVSQGRVIILHHVMFL